MLSTYSPLLNLEYPLPPVLTMPYLLIRFRSKLCANGQGVPSATASLFKQKVSLGLLFDPSAEPKVHINLCCSI